jgi:catechol 2,3-dioxygenase-like lactoylglutathione lyase family enzyme
MANQPVRPSAASSGETGLAATVKAMRPMAPAKDFETSRRFYEELGFRPQVLTEGLVEMHLGAWSFILQDYYVEQWANNFVFHVRVSDVNLWWDRIVALNLAERYRIKASAPRAESWGMVADIIDPSGVLWRIAGPLVSNSE